MHIKRQMKLNIFTVVHLYSNLIILKIINQQSIIINHPITKYVPSNLILPMTTLDRRCHQS